MKQSNICFIMLVVPDGFLSLCSLSESNQIYVSSCYGKLETCDEFSNFLCVCWVMTILFFFATGSPNFGSWKGAISTDSLAPGPSADLSDYLVLAAHRTKRPDILRAFKPYRGGWNITDNHYWAVSLLSLFHFPSYRICM